MGTPFGADPFPDLTGGKANCGGATRLDIDSFLQLAYTSGDALRDENLKPKSSSPSDLNSFNPKHLIIDVRSPAEYAQGHFPGAFNVPLFSNEQRADVGTLYCKQGRLEAIKAGLDVVGPKLRSYVDFVEAHGLQPDGEPCLVYCWRGGMRSSSVAWLLSLCSFKCYTLEGGYKGFRKWVLNTVVGQPSTAAGKWSGAEIPKPDNSSKMIKAHLGEANGAGHDDGTKTTPKAIQEYLAGESCLGDEDWQKAADCFTAAIESGHPQPGACHNRRGQCLAQLGEHERALADFQRVWTDFRITPIQRLTAFLNGSRENCSLGNFEEAEKCLEGALELQPGWKRASKELVLVRRARDTGLTAGSEQQAQAAPPPTCSKLQLFVLGGRTGSGKTRVLHEMQAMGAQMIDLEGLAQHCGSTFGRLRHTIPQPTNEHYENLLAVACHRADPQQPVWIEHEDTHVGSCHVVPSPLFKMITFTPAALVMMEIPTECRIEHLMKEYCSEEAAAGTAEWTESVKRSIVSLKKRLGGERCDKAVAAIESGDYCTVVKMMLDYYDRLYDKHATRNQNDSLIRLKCEGADHTANARYILDATSKLALSNEGLQAALSTMQIE
ncbi:hypothetical protein CYMTET_24483 [Cymbomonas tetramitiformis]|uniref:Rhodanese domain-containing protein n=1 Tax=Cymbomonas tetramitiformis TaxID=36881 RepID=A0AAE0FW80_9CHLO|nr:hypothetical protein CYMTET_24483 [Cymbomonas tetramitiformis]